MIITKFLMCGFFIANFKIKILKFRYFFNTNLEINIFLYFYMLYSLIFLILYECLLNETHIHTIYDHLYLVITKKLNH